MDCTNEAWQRLLEAAVALLEARSNQMVTAVEWDALREAVARVFPSAIQDADVDASEDAALP